MFVRNGTEMAPVSQFVTLRSVLGPEIAKRFNLYNTIDVNVNVAEGYSTGEVQKALRRLRLRYFLPAMVMNMEVWHVRKPAAEEHRPCSSIPSVWY